MTLIRVITGTETFSTGSAKLIVTLHPTTQFPLGAVASNFIGECAKNGQHVSIGQRAAFLPSSNNGVLEQGNYWDGIYNVPEGLILRVFANRRERNHATHRATEGFGVVYIRARDDGPLQRLQLMRIDHHQSTNAPVIIEGRYDIISLREVAAAGGAITTKDMTMAKPENVGLVLTQADIAPARRAAAKVKVEVVRDHDGGTVNVVLIRTKRATNLG